MKNHYNFINLLIILSFASCVKDKIEPSLLSINHTDSLIIEKHENVIIYPLANATNKTITFSIQSTDTIIIPAENSYTLLPNSTGQIEFIINNKNLADGTYFGKIYLVDGGKKITVPYRLENYYEKKIPIYCDIVDAEYYRQTGKLVFVGTHPNMLYILNTNDKKLDSIPLYDTPTCVSISPDGTRAAVGHDRMLSWIDLIGLKVLKTINCSYSIYDLVYANNKIVYLAPLYQDDLKYVNLSNNMEYVYAGKQLNNSKIKLHPSGKYLYAINMIYLNNSAMYKIQKFNIENIYPTFLYESPFSDQTVFGADFWLNDEGNVIIDNMMNTLQTSDNNPMDLTYTNSLIYSDYYWITHLDMLTSKNLIASIIYRKGENSYPSILALFNAKTLSFLKTIEPEPYWVNYMGNLISKKAEPNFVFISANGEKLIILTKSVSNHSGIEILNIK
jgi:hypothetical protein